MGYPSTDDLFAQDLETISSDFARLTGKTDSSQEARPADLTPAEAADHQFFSETSSKYRQLTGQEGDPFVPDSQKSREQLAKENMETRSEFTRNLLSGIDDTQGLLYGAAGLVGKAFHSDTLRDWGFENYKRNIEEASLNPSTFNSVSEVDWTSPGDVGTWFAGVIGKLTPTMAEIMAASTIGTVIAPGAGTVTGAFSRGIIKKAMRNKVAKAMESKAVQAVAAKSGEAAARKAAERLVAKEVGGNIGLVLGSTALEAGGMWAEGAEEFGVENSNEWTAAALGLLSGATELVAPSGTFVRRALGLKEVTRGITKETAKKLVQRAGSGQFIKAMIKAVPGTMAKEGTQEFVQEFISTLNMFVQDPEEKLFSPENIHRYIDSAAAGAAAGVLFGLGEGYSGHKSRLNEARDILARRQAAADAEEDADIAAAEAAENGPAAGKTDDINAPANPEAAANEFTDEELAAAAAARAEGKTADARAAMDQANEVMQAKQAQLDNLSRFKNPSKKQQALIKKLKKELNANYGSPDAMIINSAEESARAYEDQLSESQKVVTRQKTKDAIEAIMQTTGKSAQQAAQDIKNGAEIHWNRMVRKGAPDAKKFQEERPDLVSLIDGLRNAPSREAAEEAIKNHKLDEIRDNVGGRLTEASSEALTQVRQQYEHEGRSDLVAMIDSELSTRNIATALSPKNNKERFVTLGGAIRAMGGINPAGLKSDYLAQYKDAGKAKLFNKGGVEIEKAQTGLVRAGWMLPSEDLAGILTHNPDALKRGKLDAEPKTKNQKAAAAEIDESTNVDVEAPPDYDKEGAYKKELAGDLAEGTEATMVIDGQWDKYKVVENDPLGDGVTLQDGKQITIPAGKEVEILVSDIKGIEATENERDQVHDYSSTQVDIPGPAADEIRELGQLIPDEELYTDPKDPSYGREEKPHVTVKYGVHSADPKSIESALAGVGPFKVTMGKVSIFESDDYDVVKVDVESPELRALNKKIAESTSVTDTFPDYHPHATIAYVKKGEGQKYVGENSLEGKEITMNALTFSGKDGKESVFDLTERRRAAGKPKAGEQRSGNDRRQDTEYRKRIDEMTHDEAIAELKKDSTGLTNLLSKRAYEEDQNKKPIQVMFDMDGLGYINDHVEGGHSLGDKAISLFGRAIEKSSLGKDGVHFSGDEFGTQAVSLDEVETAKAEIRAFLEARPLEIIIDDVKYHHVLQFSTGTGDTLKNADKNLIARKGEKEREGTRPAKGSGLAAITRIDRGRGEGDVSQTGGSGTPGETAEAEPGKEGVAPEPPAPADPREKFTQDIERTGFAIDPKGRSYKIMQSDAGGFYVRITEDGFRTDLGGDPRGGGWTLGEAQAKAIDRAFPAKPAKPTKKEKALADYKAYVDSLTDEQREAVKDHTPEEPASPASQILKIKKMLANLKAPENVESAWDSQTPESRGMIAEMLGMVAAGSPSSHYTEIAFKNLSDIDKEVITKAKDQWEGRTFSRIAIGDNVQPRKGSEVPKSMAGAVTHIKRDYKTGQEKIKTENSGNLYFHNYDLEKVKRKKTPAEIEAELDDFFKDERVPVGSVRKAWDRLPYDARLKAMEAINAPSGIHEYVASREWADIGPETQRRLARDRDKWMPTQEPAGISIDDENAEKVGKDWDKELTKYGRRQVALKMGWNSSSAERIAKTLWQHLTDAAKKVLIRSHEKWAPTVKDKTPDHGKPGASEKLSFFIGKQIAEGKTTSWQALFKEADKAFGGTQAAGAYTPKDAYDAMELAVNRFISKRPNLYSPDTIFEVVDAQKTITRLQNLISLLPTQTKRTREMDQFQQFSTPPGLAYAAAWAARPTAKDTVMEPSAGVGGLAVFGKTAGAKTIVNELSPRRAELLKLMGFDRVFTENGEQLNNILPADVKPTVVLMNPPFSATAGRTQKNNTMNGARHIEQALARLAPGGRLVAIVGRGMADDRPSFKKWWTRMKAKYNVRANIGISGKEYAKYGTTFDNQILVIDKDGPTNGNIVTGFVEKFKDLPAKLWEVRNDRPAIDQEGQSSSPQSEDTDVTTQGGNPPADGSGPGPESAGLGTGKGPDNGGRTGGLESGNESANNESGSSGTDGTVKSGRNDDSSKHRPDKDRGGNGRGDSVSPGINDKELSLDELSDLFDEVAAEEGLIEKPTEAPAPPTSKGKPTLKGAATHAGKGAKKGLEAVADILKGLNQTGAIGDNLPPLIHPEAYAQAKEHLAESYNEFVAAGNEIKEWIRYALKRLTELGAPVGMSKNWILNFYAKDRPAPPEKPAETGVENVENKAEGKLTDSLYEVYRPRAAIAGSRQHPTPLVESAAMAATQAPPINYKLSISKVAIEGDPADPSKGISDIQLEAIAYAGAAHEKILPSGERKGFFIGDGTGVGKGRQISGIIWDNWNKGRKKAVWISEKWSLLKDANRDLTNVGWKEGPDLLFSQKDTDVGNAIKKKEGILFTAYSTARGGFDRIRDDISEHDTIAARRQDNDMSIRINQIIKWCGKDFDGVIAFDESHNMANAAPTKGTRGTKAASKQALAGIYLQKKLPKARVVYVSATGATEVENLVYARRLGLWGAETPFRSARDFVSKIAAGGVAAMEMVAGNMKSLGLYLARSLTYDGVKYDRMTHKLSDAQAKKYNELAQAWQIVLQNINEAVELTGCSKGQAAMSQFWGAHLRFFNQIITTMEMPSVIKAVKKDLAEGRTAVLQLIDTNEAAQNRALASLQQGQELEDLDITPRNDLIAYLENGFPVQEYETVTDEHGHEVKQPVVDSEGKPVLNAEAVQMRDDLILRIMSIKMPNGPLDYLLNEIGHENVAEVTGRSRRLEPDPETGRLKIVRRTPKHSEAETEEFDAGKRRVLIFSEAGATGRSYHADRTIENQELRRHYLVQPGWRADKAVQGLGRTHRSNQAQPPEFTLCTTDLKAQARFLSSIARRLDQLGALTRGQRQTGSQGIFQARDNLENAYARDALKTLLEDIHAGDVPGITVDDVREQMGIDLEAGDTLPDVATTQFLNRMLSMTIDMQNLTFDAFTSRMDRIIQAHSDAGTLDVGIETITGTSVRQIDSQVIRTDETGAETKYVQLDVDNPAAINDFDSIAEMFAGRGGFVRNLKSGKVWRTSPERDRTTSTGEVVGYRMLISPGNTHQRIDVNKLTPDKYEPLSKVEAQAYWEAEYEALPKVTTDKYHIITGAILPIWDRLGGKATIYRFQTDDGSRFLGRAIPQAQLQATMRSLDIEAGKVKYTGKQVVDAALTQGTKFSLEHRWFIEPVMVSGDQRIELKGPDYDDLDWMDRLGIINERIGWQARYFVPTDKRAAGIIDDVINRHPVIAIESGKRGGANMRLDSDTTFSRPSPSETDTTNKRIDEYGGRPISKETSPSQPGKVTENSKKLHETIAKLFDHLPKNTFTEVAADDVGDPSTSFARRLADIYGKKISFFHNAHPETFRFDGVSTGPLKGTVFVNADSKKPHLVIAGHEFVHEMRRDQPELYREFARTMEGMLKNFTDFKAYFDSLTTRDGTGKLSDDRIFEELLADFVGEQMMTKKFWRDFSQGKPSLFEKIATMFMNFLDKVLSQIKVSKGSEQYFNDLERARKAAAGAMSEYATRQAAGQGRNKTALSNEIADVWHSQMEGALAQKLPGKGSPAQFKQMIQAWAKKGQIKAEELEWSGLLDWLDNGLYEKRLDDLTGELTVRQFNEKGDNHWQAQAKKAAQKVSKTEVMDFLKSNRLQVKEINRGGPDPYTRTAQDWRRYLVDEMYVREAEAEDMTDQEIYGFVGEEISAGTIHNTRYENYQEPGGRNYRELLITLPPKTPAAVTAYHKALQDMAKKYGADYLELASFGHARENLFKRMPTLEVADFREIEAAYLKARNEFEGDNYQSGHWSEKNVLSHVRFNERTDADGARVLFLEEIQSDWHQAGRKEGYAKDITGWSAVRTGRKNERGRAEWTVKNPDGDVQGTVFAIREQGAIRRVAKAPVNAPPDAPWKKTWPIKTFQRMVRYAAENGFDKIAWTPGEVQAARYDLSKHIKEINYEQDTDGSDNYDLQAIGHDGKEAFSEEDITIARIEELVGKEIAQKIQSGEGRDDSSEYRSWRSLSGLDLKVGGEGMREFYDKILPAEVNKFFGKKAWGKARVGTTEVIIPKAPKLPPTHKPYPLEVWSLPITPEMRAMALFEGMPTFAGVPKKSVKAYKLFRTLKSKPGELFPLFIGKTKPVAVGKWVDGEFIPTKGFAQRPGWHAGALPIAPHLRQKATGKIAPDRVWAEVEMPADKDWQQTADQSPTRDIRDQIPEDGHYRFKTSKLQGGAWMIGGGVKVNRILTDSEVAQVLREAGFADDEITNELHDPKSLDEAPTFSRPGPQKVSDVLPAEVARRMAAAKGVDKTRFMDRLKAAGRKIKEEAAHFPGLTRIEDVNQRAVYKEILRQHQEIPSKAQDAAARAIKGFLADLTPEEYDMYSLRIILGDEMRCIEDGQRTEKNLPFGFKSFAELGNSFDGLNSIINHNPRVKKALAKRKAFQRDLAQSLVDMQVLKPEILKSDEYFHHQVLEYWNAKEAEFKGIGVSSSDARSHWRPWMASRKDSAKDYNTEYAEAELMTVAQMIGQVETAKSLRRLRQESDILGDLNSIAKQNNHQAVWDAFQFNPATSDPKDDPFLPYRQAIAMGIQNLVKMAGKEQLEYDSEFQDVVDDLMDQYYAGKDEEYDYPGKIMDSGRFFHFLSHQINAKLNGSGHAATIFKGIKSREQFTKDVLGDAFQTGLDIIPEGYTRWQPDKNKGWFWTNSIADNVLEKVVSGEKSLEDKDVRKVLAKGRSVYWVVPEGLADTMDNFRPVQKEGMFGNMLTNTMQAWKQYILMNPLSVVKYNVNNMSGDMDAVLACDPQIMKYAKKALSDLRPWMKHDPAASRALDEARDLGVIGSGFSVQEVEDTLKVLGTDRLLNDVFLGKSPGLTQKYWTSVKTLTTLRENMLRLAAFRYFQDAIKNRERGTLKNYGASNPKEVDALIRNGMTKDAAAKLARELLGDYGAISRHGEYLRSHMIPFYSWLEINTPRYVYMMRNLKYNSGEVTGGKARIAGTLAKRGSVFALKAGMLFAAVSLYNAVVWPEEEEELGEAGRRQLHIILGRRADGSIITLRFQGALSDALSWFGAEDFPNDVREVTQGKASIGDKLKEASKAVANKGLQGFRPDVKILFESLTGKKLYPNAFSPRPVRDKVENILSTVKLNLPYQWAMGRPHRGSSVPEQLANDLTSILLYTTEPGVQAYYDARRMVFDWQDKKGIEKNYGQPTSKGNALYYYKQAMKYGDLRAAKKYLKEYQKLGGTKTGLKQSIRMMHPLSGIKQTQRAAFVRGLSAKERATVERGITWYRKTYMKN